jgi:hypothetical protein
LSNEVYKKRHIRNEERIRQLQPFTNNTEPEETAVSSTGEEQVENLPAEPETVETDDIPPYPELPEHEYVGDIPQEEEEEEEEELLNTVSEETDA